MGGMAVQLRRYAFLLAFIVCLGGNGYAGFVGRNGSHFVLDGKRLYLNGFNAYWLMYMASDPSTRPKVTATFQQASHHGLNIARTWAFSDGGYKPLQFSPGSYNEEMFKGLDFVIWEAKKYGVRLMLSLVNNFEDFGGKKKYVEWGRDKGQSLSKDDDFFTNALVKQFFKNHIKAFNILPILGGTAIQWRKAVLTRINTITRIAYKDDPTIFAWELMNEPRCQSDNSGNVFQEWVREMAVFVKSIDGKHLLEIGLEGFYGETRKQINPGYQLVGTDFISNNQVPQVDFATLHIYPEQWLPGSTEAVQAAFVDRWIQAHIQDSNHVLRKPLLVGEFGKSSKFEGYSEEKRDSYYKKVYNAIYQSASSGEACAGGLFWQLLAKGMDNFRDGYEVIFEDSPSTASVISHQSQRMSSLN